ncbi:SAM-dependent methyltransferase [Streptomyces sp. GZWMJZ-114]|uniref:SAM-dependent methyltransferase n=1 Tax=Streptomyces sp. GZWMJZ-114 TaxID=2494734 RepID=UPI001010A724|nr:SAM-dependent methyltransferase [Streptomyces sp. GZWMJZ-114]
MTSGEKPPPGFIDLQTPSVARMYDALLGGVNNYAVDREACNELLRIAPSTQALAQDNRAFLRRVVSWLVAERGVKQFLDHGSGLPTQHNVHEVAQALAPESKIAYIDNDPMVHAHGRAKLDQNDGTLVIEADMRDTAAIRAQTDSFFSWDEPVAALFVSVLHCLKDADRPDLMLQEVIRELPRGSYLVVCQLVSDDAVVRADVTSLMAEATGDRWGRVRTKDEVAAFFEGLALEQPGLVDVVDWRPDSPPPPPEDRATDWVEWGGVARL